MTIFEWFGSLEMRYERWKLITFGAADWEIHYFNESYPGKPGFKPIPPRGSKDDRVGANRCNHGSSVSLMPNAYL